MPRAYNNPRSNKIKKIVAGELRKHKMVFVLDGEELTITRQIADKAAYVFIAECCNQTYKKMIKIKPKNVLIKNCYAFDLLSRWRFDAYFMDYFCTPRGNKYISPAKDMTKILNAKFAVMFVTFSMRCNVRSSTADHYNEILRIFGDHRISIFNVGSMCFEHFDYNVDDDLSLYFKKYYFSGMMILLKIM